jgi:hypothetical protein
MLTVGFLTLFHEILMYVLSYLLHILRKLKEGTV